MPNLICCSLCGGDQKDFYIYYRVFKENYEIIFCPKCAEKSSHKICFACGHFIGGQHTKYCTYYKSNKSIGYICEICLPGCQKIVERKTHLSTFEIGIYCGYCRMKREKFIFYTIMNSPLIRVAAHIYHKGFDNTIGHLYHYKKYFKRTNNNHTSNYICKKKICLIKKCIMPAWPERFGYCLRHMSDKEFKNKFANIINRSTDLGLDISKLLFEYIHFPLLF